MVLEGHIPLPANVEEIDVAMPWIMGYINPDCNVYGDVYVQWNTSSESLDIRWDKPEVFFEPFKAGMFWYNDKVRNKREYESFFKEYKDTMKRKAWVEAQTGRFLAYDIVKYFVVA
jgi:hypothetical protein